MPAQLTLTNETKPGATSASKAAGVKPDAPGLYLERRRSGRRAADAADADAYEPLFCRESADRALFVEHFDHQPFEFRHTLDRQPLFQLPALLEAAERLARGRGREGDTRSHFESGAPDQNSWFGGRPVGKTLVDALAEIESGKNWVILKRIHEDPAYAAVLADMIPELSALSGVDIARVYYDPTMTIFVTSPGRITPYHMDGETNFLAQIHGTKLAYIYDGNDEHVLSARDLERYWTGKLPKIDYPATMPHGQWQYTLRPGTGVFNPAIFPHWLQNGAHMSISVSINFKRRKDAVIGAHRTNNYLRKLGLNPAAPGASPAFDRAKEATFGRLYQAADKAAKSVKGKLKK